MNKDFDEWNQKKKKLHEIDFTGYVKEREVWWCAVGINIGVEADGKHSDFERPVLVVRKFSKDAVLIVPVTTKVKKNPYHFSYVHNGRGFALVISQVRLISTKRLLRKIYRMDDKIFQSLITELASLINKRPPQEWGPRRTNVH